MANDEDTLLSTLELVAFYELNNHFNINRIVTSVGPESPQNETTRTQKSSKLFLFVHEHKFVLHVKGIR